MRPEVRARWGRRARKIGKGTLLGLGGVIVLGGVALGILGTSFGGERLRRFVLPRVNQSIAGHVEIGRLRLHLTGLELWDVTLTDPEGHVVAQVARIEVAARLRRLLARQIEINEIVIERPDVRLKQSVGGLNLARAIAPRTPAAPAPAPPGAAAPPQLEVALRKLSLEGGTIDFRDRRPGGAAPVRIERLGVTGSAQVALGSTTFTAQLSIDAQSRLPVAAPFSLRLQGAGRGADAQAGLHVRWGGARIDLGLVSRDADRQTVTVEQILVPPTVVRAFAPDAPVRATLDGKGTIDRAGDRIEAALTLRAAEAHGQLRAAVDLARPALERLHLAMSDIDLGQLVRGAPPSHFDLKVDGQGAGRDLDTAVAQLQLEVPPGQLDGRRFGPVRIDAGADRGQVVLRSLDVALPGLTITGQGAGSATHLQAAAHVTAVDLGLTARSLRLPASLGLGGHGDLALRAAGRPSAAQLWLSARFPALRVAGNDLTGLGLSATSADLSRAPAGTNIQVKLPRARLGAQIVRDLNLTLASVGKDGVRLALTAAGPLPLSLTAAGRASAGGKIIDLDSLALAYPESSWHLAQPVRLRTGGGDIALGKVDLQAAPDQRLQIDLALRGRRIDAHAVVSKFDLGRLPALAQPPGNRLAGLVDVTLAATGRLPRPDATIDLQLHRAKVAGRLDDVGLQLRAQHHAGRMAGTLAASVLGAQHDIDFDLPTAWPLPAAARLHLRGTIGQIDLAHLMALTRAPDGPAPPPLQGQLSAGFALDGPAGDPALSLTATAQQLRWGGERLDDVQLTVQDPIGKPLQVVVATRILDRASRVSVDSPVVIGAWLRRPPDGAALLAVPFVVTATIDRLALAAVSPRTRGKPDLTGTVSMRASLTGPVSRLHGILNLDADEVAGMGIPATSAHLATRLGEGRAGLDAHLTLIRHARPFAELTAALGVGLDDLLARRSLSSLGAAKLQVKGHVGPLALQRMVAGADGGRKGRRAFRTDLEANLSASGTLGDPRFDLRLGVQGAQLAGRPLGGGRVQLTYRDAAAALNLQLNSAGGGQLTVAAKADVDLSLPGIKRGINPSEIPIDAKVAAHGFDLAFLSGVQDDLRSVEGRLEADAQVTGRVGTPQLVGKLAWRAGRLVLAGQGEMRDIELVAHGDPQRMVLERLFARSGAGTATVSGSGVRDPAGRTLTIDARADLSRFRLLTDGQPLGALSLAAKATGTLSPERTAIATTISEARMELADGDRRDLQSLKRPDDVVLLVNGEPLDKAQARRYDALVNRPPPVQTPPMSTAADAAPVPAKSTRTAAEESPGIHLTVNAPRNLWVRGADANLEAGLDPGFLVVQAEATRVFGTVKVKRGFVEVLGRRFDVASGSSVQFTGPVDRPVLTVDATYKLQQAQSDSPSVVVHVEGPADKLSIAMSSPGHPEYGDSDLLSMIVTGRVPDAASKAGFQAEKKAQSLVGGLVAARVQKAVTAHLPIDVFNLDAGDETTGPRLEAGTYVRDDVYVAYVGRALADPMGRENRNELHLEYQLTPRWSFEATYGDARRGSVDLLWTRNY